MATEKVVTYRLANKFQVKDKTGAVAVSSGCTTMFELDNFLHAYVSSVEGAFTSLYRMKCIKSAKDIDKLQIGLLPGMVRFADVEGNWNGKTFPIRFEKHFKYDDVATFSPGIQFAGATFLKNKIEVNPAIEVSPSSAGNGEIYPVNSLSKGKGHYLIYAKKLGPVPSALTIQYSVPSPTLASITEAQSSAFCIPYVWRRYKAIMNKNTKKLDITDEAFVGTYDNSTIIPFEKYVVLNNAVTTKSTNVTVDSYRKASVPAALDLFYVKAPSNNIIATVNSKMGVSNQRTETATQIVSTDYIIQNVNPSIFFYHDVAKPYASQHNVLLNKKYLVQEFKDFCNRARILGGHFETRIIDSGSSPNKTNIPIVTIVGCDYISKTYSPPAAGVYATTNYAYQGPLHYHTEYRNNYPWYNSFRIKYNIYKHTAQSELKIFSYVKTAKPHALISTPARQIFAIWDRYYEGAAAPNPTSEGLATASTVTSGGFIKHAPIYMHDTVMSADKKSLFVLNVLADAFVFPYKAFGMTEDRYSTGYADKLHKAWVTPGAVGVKALKPTNTVTLSAPRDAQEKPTEGPTYWSSTNARGSGEYSALIPAELPSRKLYCDVLDISALPVQIKRRTIPFGQGKATSTFSKIPLSTGNMMYNSVTGVSACLSKSGQNVYGAVEDMDSVDKILDFKVVYMKKRVFVAILKVGWAGKTYANCVGAIPTANHNGSVGGNALREFTLNYPDRAWIEIWEMNFATNSFGSFHLKTKAFQEDIPWATINIGVGNDYALPVIHEPKADSAIAGDAINGWYGPTLDEVTNLEDFARYKGEFLQAVYNVNGFQLMYCPHNKYGKNIQLYTAPATAGGTYFETRWKDVDAGNNYLIVVENIK